VRVFGLWWLWRAVSCTVAAVVLTVFHAALHHRRVDFSMFLLPIFMYFHFGGAIRRQLRLAETDLEVARAFHADWDSRKSK